MDQIDIHKNRTVESENQGMPQVLLSIKAAVKSVLPGSKILLFGSHARGDFNEASDYDLLIVTEEPLDAKGKFPLRTRIRKLLLEQGIFSDVLIQSDEEIERKRNLPGHVIKEAMKEGIAL